MPSPPKVTIKRLIYCVDGTWHDPDGPDGDPKGNQTNVFRIFATTKDGKFESSDGRRIIQVNKHPISGGCSLAEDCIQIRKYDPGTGVGEEGLKRISSAIWATDIPNRIKEITKYCCQTLTGPDDELWLYGYSRGAYIVRAVAGIFHHMGALRAEHLTDSKFDEAYKKTLELYRAVQDKDEKRAGSSVCLLANFGVSSTFRVRDPPCIKFVGAFDTVRAYDDKKLYDISVNDTIETFRHAVAIHEDRLDFSPELVSVQDSTSSEPPNRIIQAWFFGAHKDLGGGVAHDGLSLYPLQWMLIESRKSGLVLEFKPIKRSKMTNPLDLVALNEGKLAFQEADRSSQCNPKDISKGVWKFEYQNGIIAEMHDLRAVHRHGNLRKTISEKSGASHTIQLNRGRNYGFRGQQRREVFKMTKLKGYCESSSNGTIIHPSIFFILDTYEHLRKDFVRSRLREYYPYLQDFQTNEIANSEPLAPWNVHSVLQKDKAESFRILVCGKTGVGKSTLINLVFGVPDLTTESDNERGEHDINQAIETDMNPGLLVHDSRGLESGSRREVILLQNFIRSRSGQKDPKEQLNAIWFCVDLNETRLVQKADEDIFKTIARYAINTPVVIVGTKKDKVLKLHRAEAVDAAENMSFEDDRARKSWIKEEANKGLKIHQQRINKKLQTLGNHRSSSIVCTSKDDPTSIKDLLGKTLKYIDDNEVRQFCVAAQCCDVDLKVDEAITEALRLYFHAVSAAISPSPIPSSISTYSMSTTVCAETLRCFGFQKIRPEAIDAIIRNIVWSNINWWSSLARNTLNLGLATLCGIFTFGPGAAIGAVGGIFEAVPTAKVIIRCSCDIILILERAFAHAQGDIVWEDSIKRAAEAYADRNMKLAGCKELQSRADLVHEEINNSLGCWDIKRCFQPARIRKILEDVINNHRVQKQIDSTSTGSADSPGGALLRDDSLQ
ncbi:MAG: hypothetical protein M1834_005601 [Cirrosporium novae-zelandiae]|nr:MAG: hypothetical protein M1834_005601 [Cirrosporium novae-zelandiae]